MNSKPVELLSHSAVSVSCSTLITSSWSWFCCCCNCCSCWWPIYLAMYWRAKLRAKAAAEAGGTDMDMGMVMVMGRERNALCSPPIDNGADAVGETVGATAGSAMWWLLVLLLLKLWLPLWLYPPGYGCFGWPVSGAGAGAGAGDAFTTGLGVGELEVEGGDSRCLSKLTRWWRRHFARLLENQTWLINRWRDNLLVDQKKSLGSVLAAPSVVSSGGGMWCSNGEWEWALELVPGGRRLTWTLASLSAVLPASFSRVLTHG